MEDPGRRRFLKLALGCSLEALLLSVPRVQASKSPSLEEMAGAMVMGGFRGTKAPLGSPIVEFIQKYHLGSVVLYDYDLPTHSPHRNIQSPRQVKDLDSTLRACSSLPLTIAIDQEGGEVSRLKERYGFPPTLSAQQLGEKDDPAYTYREALKMAKTLKNLGITLNLAPVVDLNVNPNNPVIGKLGRSFSANPQIVVQQALAFIQAHHSQGIKCTLKHFPGHGSSTTDSHRGFVDITETWSPRELLPFKELIRLHMADAIMTAHVFNAKLDPLYPATLSKKVITGILRERLGYQGTIISDDIQMGAIRKYYGFQEAIALAIEAGVDIILIANNTIYDATAIPRAVSTIVRLVEEGRIPRKRLEASYQRILTLKRTIPLQDRPQGWTPPPHPPAAPEGTPYTRPK